MKKFLVFLLVFAGVVVGGGFYVKHKATQVISNQVSKQINSPEGQQTIHQILSNPKVQQEIKKYANSGGAGSVSFSSQQAAVNYAVSKLSPGEMAQLANDYAHRNSLTPAQKTQIESQILSKFTPQQLAAMAQTLNK